MDVSIAKHAAAHMAVVATATSLKAASCRGCPKPVAKLRPSKVPCELEVSSSVDVTTDSKSTKPVAAKSILLLPRAKVEDAVYMPKTIPAHTVMSNNNL